MKNIVLIMLCLGVIGCSTVAFQSKDGKALKIRGSGSAKFENGAEIVGKTWLPELKVFR